MKKSDLERINGETIAGIAFVLLSILFFYASAFRKTYPSCNIIFRCANNTILDTNVWGNATTDDLIQDSKKALNVLIQQPEVDPKRISIIGHSEGTLYAPRLAIDNSTNVKNIILMGVLAQNPVKVAEYYQDVSLPLEYATQVLDKNHTGLISIQQIANDPLLRELLVPSSVMHTNNNNAITTTLAKGFGTSGYISIEKQLKALLTKVYENITAFNLLKCNYTICPILMRVQGYFYNITKELPKCPS